MTLGIIISDIMCDAERLFTKAQKSQIILQYGKLGSATLVRRWFRKQYPNIPNSKIPKVGRFWRLIEKFKKTANTENLKSPGRPATAVNDQNVEKVRELIKSDETLSIKQISEKTGISTKAVWIILRERLNLYPYKPHCVHPLTEDHKQRRLEFCSWLLQQSDNFPQKVIFSDEKKFQERSDPNRQNVRYWGEEDPNVRVENRIQGGKSLMCWAALIDGSVIIHWYEEKETVNPFNYLETLKNVMWPKIKRVSNAQGYVFQQDGAPSHTTEMVREWLASKFGTRVISNKTEREWPPKSPDLSPLDYWFWGLCLSELWRSRPSSMAELKAIINDLAENLSKDEVRKAVNDIKVRAEVCRQENGSHFEHLLKKHKRGNEE